MVASHTGVTLCEATTAPCEKSAHEARLRSAAPNDRFAHLNKLLDTLESGVAGISPHIPPSFTPPSHTTLTHPEAVIGPSCTTPVASPWRGTYPGTPGPSANRSEMFTPPPASHFAPSQAPTLRNMSMSPKQQNLTPSPPTRVCRTSPKGEVKSIL